ncbi:Gluconate transport-inducing protein required for gluconate-H+ symport [Sporothrix epigloea]|uniref:Gluconate transport-inducing protein required for gluconate-H+ symport n=1 Tax=Sporothrix epigloea TaxID=1892477 RepID=A0ABP0DLG6_9PEZI
MYSYNLAGGYGRPRDPMIGANFFDTSELDQNEIWRISQSKSHLNSHRFYRSQPVPNGQFNGNRISSSSGSAVARSQFVTPGQLHAPSASSGMAGADMYNWLPAGHQGSVNLQGNSFNPFSNAPAVPMDNMQFMPTISEQQALAGNEQAPFLDDDLDMYLNMDMTTPAGTGMLLSANTYLTGPAAYGQPAPSSSSRFAHVELSPPTNEELWMLYGNTRQIPANYEQLTPASSGLPTVDNKETSTWMFPNIGLTPPSENELSMSMGGMQPVPAFNVQPTAAEAGPSMLVNSPSDLFAGIELPLPFNNELLVTVENVQPLSADNMQLVPAENTALEMLPPSDDGLVVSLDNVQPMLEVNEQLTIDEFGQPVVAGESISMFENVEQPPRAEDQPMVSAEVQPMVSAEDVQPAPAIVDTSLFSVDDWSKYLSVLLIPTANELPVPMDSSPPALAGDAPIISPEIEMFNGDAILAAPNDMAQALQLQDIVAYLTQQFTSPGLGPALANELSVARNYFKDQVPASILGNITYKDNKDAKGLSAQHMIQFDVKAALILLSKTVQPLARIQQYNLSDNDIFNPEAAFHLFVGAQIGSAALLGIDGLSLAKAYIQNESAAKVVVRLVVEQRVSHAQVRPDSGFPVDSGYVYVYKEGGSIKRWTDDRCWTPSRKGKNKCINIYREVKQLSSEERKKAAEFVVIKSRKTVPISDEERKKKQSQESNLAGKIEDIRHETVTLDNCEKLLFVRPEELAFGAIDMDSAADELVGPLTHCSNLLVQGLVKRTFKVKHGNANYTVVNYYNIRDVLNSEISALKLLE